MLHSHPEKLQLAHATFIPETHVISNSHPEALTEILNASVNLAVWEREIEHALQLEVEAAVYDSEWKDLRVACNAEQAATVLNELWGARYPLLRADIALLVDMFDCLFSAEQVAIRIAKLERAMCPRFHVDKIPCRLVTTYVGAGSEWLHETDIQRQFLGRGANGKPDHSSGLIAADAKVQRLQPGHVGLLKGDAWIGNEGRGLVHRSPAADANSPRIVLTLDFSS